MERTTKKMFFFTVGYKLIPECAIDVLSFGRSLVNSWIGEEGDGMYRRLHIRRSGVQSLSLLVQGNATGKDAESPRNGNQQNRGSGERTNTDCDLLLHRLDISETGEEN